MLNTLKLLINRFRPKREIEHKLVAPEACHDSQPRKNMLVKVSSYEIRQPLDEELHASDVTARQRDREYMDKWFNRGELTNSGSHRIAEFERRMEETPSADFEFIEALPAQEDMLMAFAKPEFDLFEEEKISLSGVFLRVDPNEDFDEQYSMPLLPMYRTNDDLIILDQAPLCSEEFNLNCSIDHEFSTTMPALKTLVQELSGDDSTLEETLQDLIAVPKSMIPAPTPAFIQVPSAVVEERKIKIDPSALFEEWIKEEVFDASTSENPAAFATSEPASCEAESVELDSAEIVSTEIVSESPSIQNTARTGRKSNVKLMTKPTNEAYWSESDRLTRFGRRKTSASCSSTRLKALPQIA